MTDHDEAKPQPGRDEEPAGTAPKSTLDDLIVSEAGARIAQLRAERDLAVEALRGLVEACDSFRDFVANERDNGVGEIEARNEMFVALRTAREVLDG